MPEKGLTHAVGHDSTKPKSEDKNSWPRSYKLLPPHLRVSAKWWSHNLYRGPADKKVEILYSKTKADSEAIARRFLNEPLIGFDMEWPWDSHNRSGLQNKVSLIQIACEDKIALFHISLHQGTKTDDLIAPTLRKIIETPTIGKIGVCILNADFARLKNFFKLQPKGAVEISHLYRLVRFGAWKPELVTTKPVSLADQVENQLGLPLYKGDVRTSDWSLPLNQKQVNYAAGDAYAGYMLYHCLNAKRLKMDPIPPLPIHAERYLPFSNPPKKPLRLEPLKDGDEIVMSDTFFAARTEETVKDRVARETDAKTDDLVAGVDTGAPKSEPTTKPPMASDGPLDAASTKLYNDLVRRRKALAMKEGIPPYLVASNAELKSIARERPLDETTLLRIKGIGQKKNEKYGAQWLEVVKAFLATEQPGLPVVAADIVSEISVQTTETTTIQQPKTPTRRSRPRRAQGNGSPSSSPAFGTPPTERQPQLHTGLSFTFAETKLDAQQNGPCANEVAKDSEGVSHSSTPLSRSLSRSKRKRTPSLDSLEATALSRNVHDITSLDGANDSADKDLSKSFNGPAETGKAKSMGPDANIIPRQCFTPRSKIFRNKLDAFSKLVTRKLEHKKPNAGPIVADWTLDRIVATSPRTLKELHGIPGVEGLVQACKETNMDLLKNIIKFAPARF